MIERRSLAPLVALALYTFVATGQGLEAHLGRNDVRIRSAAFAVPLGHTALEVALPERLAQLGYRRVHDRPAHPGEYFFGKDTFWIFRRGFRWGGHDLPARLVGFEVDGRGRLTRLVAADGAPTGDDDRRLEPLTIGEALGGAEARRSPVAFDRLPDQVWQAVLAAEDARFFHHRGIDGKSIARALLRNLSKGRVAEGGSTITQQLVKNRDLTPKRTLGRKASEAVRALMLEGDYTKEEILEAYLGSVYMGHVDGVAIHGFPAAARVYFSRSLARLDLAEAATLAAMIQGPNRLDPIEHPERVKKRRDWVLDRMVELGFVDGDAARRAGRGRVGTRRGTIPRYPATHFSAWTARAARTRVGSYLDEGRGIVVETSLDPYLQVLAERAVADGLDGLRRGRGAAPGRLTAALVALDGATGDVLAYVGGDPESPDAFDRAGQARRQPGSTIKPLLLLEAFQSCGRQRAIHPATRVLDEPFELDLPSGPWRPENADRKFRGAVTIDEALVRSLNVPFVRIACHCGLDETAATVRRAGLDLPTPAPPAFTLGAVETSPLLLAGAYTTFATPGSATTPRPILRLEKPGGRRLATFGTRNRRVVSPAAAYVVRALMEDVVATGSAASVAIPSQAVAAKTGTSSGGRDAWLAGVLGELVVVAWVGSDDDDASGLGGSRTAAPIWRAFVASAIAALPSTSTPPPAGLVSYEIDLDTGRRAGSAGDGTRTMLFRKRVTPPRTRWLIADGPTEPIR